MFDKSKFAQILKNISDTYDSQRDFSQKSKINRTYLSQYINMKLDEPPKPSILQKLANHSNGITDYEELMIICGYINKDIEFSEIEKKIFNKHLSSLKELNLDENLLDIMYKMSIEPSKYSEDFDSLVSKLPKEIQDKVYAISSKILTEINDMMRNAINNIKIMSKYNIEDIIDNDKQNFRFAYHKETEGLSDEDIKEALRIYKEIKNRVEKKDN